MLGADSEFVLNGHTFRYVHDDDPGGMSAPPEEGFNIYKVPGMLDHYEREAALLGPITTIVELGIFHGGSSVLLAEKLKPKRLIAFDYTPSSPSAAFDRYVAEHGVIEPHWGVDQADSTALIRAVGDAPIDMVVDDASHLYEPTVASFNALFPRLRPGGMYFIEDWGWPYQESWAESSGMRWQRSVSDIVGDLARVKISSPGVIGRLQLTHASIIVERGQREFSAMDLANDGYRRSDYRRNARHARRTASRPPGAGAVPEAILRRHLMAP